MKRLVCCLSAVLIFSGCVQQQQKKEKPRIVESKRQDSNRLIMPSKELSALSEQSERCAFVLPFTKKRAPKKLSAKEQAYQIEARLVDIPIPVSVTPVAVSFGDRGNKLLSYTSSLSASEIKKFYIQEMERFGWKQEYYFEGDEVLLSFKKPDRFCSVSVRPERKSWDTSKRVQLHVFVS